MLKLRVRDFFSIGEIALASKLLSPFSTVKSLVLSIDSSRARVRWCTLGEILTTGGIVLCFGSEKALPWAVALIVVRTVLGLVASAALNRGASDWSIALQQVIKLARKVDRVLHSILVQQGLSEEDIRNLRNAPQEVYSCELQGAQRSLWLCIGNAIACSTALAVLQQWGCAAAVIIAGLLAIPAGEWIYKTLALPCDRRRRIASSAGDHQELQKAGRMHQQMALTVNGLSQLPILLFAFKLLLNTDFLFASFWALTQGLMGFTGMIAFQRLRVTHKRLNDNIEKLLKTLASSPFLFSKICAAGHLQPHHLVDQREPGVYFQNLHASGFGSGSAIRLTGHIPGGSIGLIEAPSGSGKSLLLQAIQRLLDHSGAIELVDATSHRHVASLSEAELAYTIVHLSLDQLPLHLRIVDLFAPWFSSHAAIGFSLKPHLTLAKSCEDVLLENEIRALESTQSSIFQKADAASLKAWRDTRAAWVLSLLQAERGHLGASAIHPQRTVGSLSTGEQQSLLGLLAKTIANLNSSARLLILDEPLAHLDEVNRRIQTERLQFICTNQPHLAILVITHGHVDELTNLAPNTRCLDILQTHRSS